MKRRYTLQAKLNYVSPSRTKLLRGFHPTSPICLATIEPLEEVGKYDLHPLNAFALYDYPVQEEIVFGEAITDNSICP